MKKLLILLLYFPMMAVAETAPGDPGEFVRAVQGLVKAEKVVINQHHRSGAGDVGLLIPEQELFSSPNELKESGRLVLERANHFARQKGKKLTILVPDQRQDQDYRPVAYSLLGGKVRRNVFVGHYVYIVIAQTEY